MKGGKKNNEEGAPFLERTDGVPSGLSSAARFGSWTREEETIAVSWVAFDFVSFVTETLPFN